jgi:hypothetical protein
LEPVLARIAEVTGAYAAIKSVPDGGMNMSSRWCILTWDDDRFLRLITKEDWQPVDTLSSGKKRVWSDDYSTILPIINMEELAAALKSFKPLTW